MIELTARLVKFKPPENASPGFQHSLRRRPGQRGPHRRQHAVPYPRRIVPLDDPLENHRSPVGGPLQRRSHLCAFEESALYKIGSLSVRCRAAANARGSPPRNTLALRPSIITSRNIGWLLQVATYDWRTGSDCLEHR